MLSTYLHMFALLAFLACSSFLLFCFSIHSCARTLHRESNKKGLSNIGAVTRSLLFFSRSSTKIRRYSAPYRFPRSSIKIRRYTSLYRIQRSSIAIRRYSFFFCSFSPIDILFFVYHHPSCLFVFFPLLSRLPVNTVEIYAVIQILVIYYRTTLSRTVIYLPRISTLILNLVLPPRITLFSRCLLILS
jgi:hypothetical protein